MFRVWVEPRQQILSLIILITETSFIFHDYIAAFAKSLANLFGVNISQTVYSNLCQMFIIFAQTFVRCLYRNIWQTFFVHKHLTYVRANVWQMFDSKPVSQTFGQSGCVEERFEPPVCDKYHRDKHLPPVSICIDPDPDCILYWSPSRLFLWLRK